MVYSVPIEAAQLLRKGILQNPLLTANIPNDASSLADYVTFTGNENPNIPINWRFAESISALKGLESLWINALLKAKYNHGPVKVEIDTDHATLFVMSTLLIDVVDENGKAANPDMSPIERIISIFPSPGRNFGKETPHRSAITNIYKTQDGRCYHLHGSMNPTPSSTALGLDPDRQASSPADALSTIQERVQQHTAADLDELMNEKYRQAGTICYSTDEYKASDHGKANAHVGLYELNHVPNDAQKPGWWKAVSDTGVARPLAGLKVVDLCRVIAGPSISKGLAELGASVMRVTGPGVVDVYALHADLNWGKWNCSIDLKIDEGKETLRQLILEADVVLDGYRPGVMENLGFGRDAVLELVKDRPFGLVYARENCYGWHGPWQHRSGWQQISDANCGVSLEYGRAMGHDEAVTPVFPNSDYCTGVLGVCGVINALIERGNKGGSFLMDTALNYYSQWLVNSVGVYPPSVWENVWQRHNRLTFRHNDNMLATIPLMMKSLMLNSGAQLFQPRFFEIRYSGAVDRYFKVVRPVLSFGDKQVDLRFNVGTRSNGQDAARWPEDLRTEIVTSA
ncbi:CoA-transferase family III domain-containing protein [Aspergillus pseudotamarii]|uniref:CoA-transferase family III domain-containing protein n=1 Tax=Aspergillus pseudotamarii TaxID=132259 RepID=A0A5N6T9D0_ASPPS|nr:CoA-transferase family III domain-containing protein [Aspergillus pseudotamarii]KAE8142912.1 CoA-transferase family III domain-containing protein [Aspergillus pseudotamarii]